MTARPAKDRSVIAESATLRAVAAVAAVGARARCTIVLYDLGDDTRPLVVEEINPSSSSGRRSILAKLHKERQKEAAELLVNLAAMIVAERVRPADLARPADQSAEADGAAGGSGELVAVESDVDTMVERLNQEFAVVMHGDAPAILWDTVDEDGRRHIKPLTKTGFRDWLQPQKILLGEKTRCQADVWLNDARRRQYRGVCFNPAGDAPKGYFNLWTGFTVERDDRGAASCQLFLDHVAENICGGDPDLFAWVMGWAAHLFQHPTERTGIALVLRGQQGVGKSKFGEVLGVLLGRHHKAVSDPRYITGRFNSHLIDCLLLQCEEAFWAGDHQAEGRLKDLITSSSQLIEFKGRESIRVHNYVRLLVTSNADWVVPAALDNRRFAVFDVGEGRKEDHVFFEAMDRQLAAGGYGKLLDYLLTYDLADVPYRTIPDTAALFEQKVTSLSRDQRWWVDVLMSGALPGDVEGDGSVPVETLYQDYLRRLSEVGESRKMGTTAFGMFLKRYFDGVELRKRRRMPQPSGKSRDLYVYEFPPLRECRRRFDEKSGVRTEWPTDPSSWVEDHTAAGEGSGAGSGFGSGRWAA